MVSILTLALVRADDVNMEINVNGTANFNISVSTEDSELREDVYGTEGNSPAEDVILQYINEHKDDPNPGWEEMGEICNDPAFDDYFKSLSSIPPDAFIQHMKAMGYDDVTQISVLWSMCLEERMNANEEEWSTDTGISQNRVANLIEGAIDWLFGRNPAPVKEEVDIGNSLDSYFASDKDLLYVLRRVNDLTLRVEALENSMDEVASEAYCRGKLKVMMDYGLDGVRCDDTTYFNHMYTPTGEDLVIGITPVNGDELNGEEPEEEIGDGTEEYTQEIFASGEEETVEQNNVVLNALTLINSGMNDFSRGTLLLASSFLITILVFHKTFPTIRGYVFKEMAPEVQHLGSFMLDKTINITNSIINTPDNAYYTLRGHVFNGIIPGVQFLGSFMLDKTDNINSMIRSRRKKEEKFTYSFGKGWLKG